MKRIFHPTVFLKTAVVLLLLAGLCLTGCEEKATIGSGKKPGTEKPTEPDKPEVPDSDLTQFPANKDPKTVGEGVVTLFINSGNSNWGDMHSTKKSGLTSYPDVCAWLGAFWYAEAAGNNALFDRLVAKFDQFLEVDDKNREPNKSLVTKIPRTENNAVDYNIFGAVPLHIYTVLKKRGKPESAIKKYLDLGLPYADQQWGEPNLPKKEDFEKPEDYDKYLKNTPNAEYYHNLGYSYQTRLWIDDMFMITALQSQAYLATKDEKYIARAAEEMMLYLDKLPGEEGIFYHSLSAKYFWARGNGWMAVGMPEMLRMLPKTAKYDAYRDRILAEYKAMMATLLRYQRSSGLWGQLITPDKGDMWEETSGSAMFTYAMILGVKNGWLDKESYGAAARKGWLGVQNYLNTNYEIRNVCGGTGAHNPDTGDGYAYYRDRAKNVGDLHGQAAMMWCAYALTELAAGQ